MAEGRDDAYLLALAQGRITEDQASSWLGEQPDLKDRLADALDLDCRYWIPLLARWAANEAPIAFHEHIGGNRSLYHDVMAWASVEQVEKAARQLEDSVAEHLRGTGTTLPAYDVKLVHLHTPDTQADMWAMLTADLTLENARQRARRMAATVVCYRRSHHQLPLTLAPPSVVANHWMQPHGKDELVLGYRILGPERFEIRYAPDHQLPAYVSPLDLEGATTSASVQAPPIQEWHGGLRIDCAALEH